MLIKRRKVTGLLTAVILFGYLTAIAGSVSHFGELKKWHKVTVEYTSDATYSQTGTPNPFTDRRLIVTFTNGGTVYDVEGYFAADGNAADTSSDSGAKWHANFAPDQVGIWNYTARFYEGGNVSIADNLGAPIDTQSGSFSIASTDKAGVDLRGKGMAQYVGKHHIRFAETGEYYLKGGADSPENFLGYYEFDDTQDLTGGADDDNLGADGLHNYAPHAVHYDSADASAYTWAGGKGKNILGAINYLSDQGMNSIYFLTYNIDGGDGRDTHPWPGDGTDKYRFSCAKLAQWERVFSYMDKKGIMMHVVLQEVENDDVLGGPADSRRKLYLRELAARFAHHLNVTWNLGEENSNTEEERRGFAQLVRRFDPYDHPISLHIRDNNLSVYEPFYDEDVMEVASIQSDPENTNNAQAIEVRNKSLLGKRPWIACEDEQNKVGVAPDLSNFDNLRKETLWGNLCGGGGGVEWYFYYYDAQNWGDIEQEDWTGAETVWQQTKHALDFFQTYLPFHEMGPANELLSSNDAFCMFKPREVYLVYNKGGSLPILDLTSESETMLFSVQWYDPVNGGSLQNSSITYLNGGGKRSLGSAPGGASGDWAILVKKATTNPSNLPPVAKAGGDRSVYDSNSSGDETVTLDASGSYDPDGSIASYEWYSSDPTSGGLYFKEENGRVVIEVDDTSSALGAWVKYTDVASMGALDPRLSNDPFLEDACLRFTGNSETSGAVNSILSLPIKITTPGNYGIAARCLGAPLETNETDKANDCYLRIVGQPDWLGIFKKYVIGGRLSWEWSWFVRADKSDHVFEIPVYNLDAGVHTLQFAGRSKNFFIDRVVLSKDINTVTNLKSYGSSAENFPVSPKTGGGQIGSGSSISMNLQTGTHTFFLKVTDNGGMVAYEQIRITVENVRRPTVSFTSPQFGETIEAGSDLPVVVDANDTDGSIQNVLLKVNGQNVRTDNSFPYEWGGSGDTELHSLAQGLYQLTAVATDNNGNTNEVSQYVIVSDSNINSAPQVNASSDQTIILPVNTVTLSGGYTDDGLPSGTVTTQWTQTGGPASATIQYPGQLDTQVTFPSEGTYVFTLAADDGDLVGGDTVQVTVHPVGGPVNTAPTVSISADSTVITLPTDTVSLNGIVYDDGLPGGNLTYLWTQESGPVNGALIQSPTSEDTTVQFTVIGTFSFKLTVNDGELSSSETIQIVLNPEPVNIAPSISFETPTDGSVISEGSNVYVKVNASDSDGSVAFIDLFMNSTLVRRENNAPYEWGAASQNDTALTAMAAGTYELEAVATDNGGKTASAVVTITVESGTTHTLTVNNGSGDGNYAEGTVVSISADPAPVGKQFGQWTGDIAYVENVNTEV